MRHRTHGKPILETRVDYVESRLDETISNFKDAIKDLKEAMQQMENRHQANFLQMENRHQANFQQMENRHKESIAGIKELIEKSEARTEAIAKDSRTSRNWTIATCIAVLTLVATIASGIVGQILTAIASY